MQSTAVRALQLGDEAPDFTAETTEGTLQFHRWLGDSWGCCSRTPRTSLPCARRSSVRSLGSRTGSSAVNCKVIGLSVDPVDSHHLWARDIEEVTGCTPQLPAHRRSGIESSRTSTG